LRKVPTIDVSEAGKTLHWVGLIRLFEIVYEDFLDAKCGAGAI